MILISFHYLNLTASQSTQKAKDESSLASIHHLAAFQSYRQSLKFTRQSVTEDLIFSKV
jgi:hypothetical protein